MFKNMLQHIITEKNEKHAQRNERERERGKEKTTCWKKPWHNTDPPPSIHRVRIILGKIDTIPLHCTDQNPTLTSLDFLGNVCLSGYSDDHK